MRPNGSPLLLPRSGSRTRFRPVLHQLRSRWPVNLERRAQFVSALPRVRRHAIEFREPGWHGRLAERVRGRVAVFASFNNDVQWACAARRDPAPG